MENSQANNVESFNIAVWRAEVSEAALSFESAAKVLMGLALKARGMIEADTAREAFKEAFGNAFANTRGVAFEEAVKSKTVQNRVSDAMAIFGATVLPGSLPDNLQQAAKACREANPKGARKPRAGGKAPAEANPVADAMAALEAALLDLASACDGNERAVDVLGDLKDMASALRDALLGGDVIEGELAESA